MRLFTTLPTCLLLLGASPAVAVENAVVEMQTSAGSIMVEVYEAAAPITATNFLRYVDAGHYDGQASFYRTVRMDNQEQNAIKIEVIQGGLGVEPAPSWFEPIAHETTQVSGVLHQDGVISMARQEPGSARSEFFICINDQPALDYGGQRNPDGQGFAAFGKVIEGMDVVRRIHAMQTDSPGDGEPEYTSGQMLLEPVTISRVRRLE